MPTYDYRCRDCHNAWDEFQSNKVEPTQKCPACGKDSAERIISTSAQKFPSGGEFQKPELQNVRIEGVANALGGVNNPVNVSGTQMRPNENIRNLQNRFTEESENEEASMSISERHSAAKTVQNALTKALATGTDLVQDHPGTTLVFCCLAMFGGQFWSLGALYNFDRERELWSASENERKTKFTALEEDQNRLSREISSLTIQLGEMKAEVSTKQIERNRVSGELAEIQKQLSLARIAESDAVKSQQVALQESEKVLSAKTEAETRISELATKKQQLETEISSAREQNEPLLENVNQAKGQLQKINGDITTAMKQSSDGETQVEAIQRKLSELRDQIVKESASLETAITENGKALRRREEFLSETAAAEQASKRIKAEDEKLKLEIAELQKEIVDLSTQKLELTKGLGVIESQNTAAQTQLDGKMKDLASVTENVAKLTAEEKRLQDAIKELTDKLPQEDAVPQNQSTGN
jgi:putative FmdB family regulatory protein